MNSQIRIAKTLLTSSILVMCSACATQRTLLTAPMVSMTDSNEAAPNSLKPAGNIESSYCYGDEPLATKNKNDIGLMDEVIFRAQQQSGAKFIQNATFIAEGKCLKLDGIAMK